MRIRLALVACAALLVACSREPKPDESARTPAEPDVWVIVGHRMPGVSAMTEAEAFNRHGHLIQLGTRLAISEPDTCVRPVYRKRHARADSLLAMDYHIQSSDLGLPADATLRVTDVLCGDTNWSAPGGRILWDAPDHGFTVWDGVFFELRLRAKKPDSH